MNPYHNSIHALRDILLCHFRNMLLYVSGYTVACSYLLCIVASSQCEIHINEPTLQE